jgi:hypothetical protein
MLTLLLIACTGGPKDTGLDFDQPGIHDPTAPPGTGRGVGTPWILTIWMLRSPVYCGM